MTNNMNSRRQNNMRAAREELQKEIGGIFKTPDANRKVWYAVDTCKYTAAMLDLAACIRWARANGYPEGEIGFTIAHDLFQFGKKLFVPRSHGYAARERAAKNGVSINSGRMYNHADKP